jgi:hypothetical protein
VKVGDRVELIGIPKGVKDDRELQTRTLFEKCLGKTFRIAGLENVKGLPFPLVRLDVGDMVGKEAFMETIWVEPEYLQLEDSL